MITPSFKRENGFIEIRRSRYFVRDSSSGSEIRVQHDLRVAGADEEGERAREFPDRRGVFARAGGVRPEPLRLTELARPRGERGPAAAVRGGDLPAHGPQPANADDAYPIARLGVP